MCIGRLWNLTSTETQNYTCKLHVHLHITLAILATNLVNYTCKLQYACSKTNLTPEKYKFKTVKNLAINSAKLQHKISLILKRTNH